MYEEGREDELLKRQGRKEKETAILTLSNELKLHDRAISIPTQPNY